MEQTYHIINNGMLYYHWKDDNFRAFLQRENTDQILRVKAATGQTSHWKCGKPNTVILFGNRHAP